MRLDVATVATGQLTEVPNTFVSSDALFAFGWPGEGDSLVAEFTFMPTIQLASWHRVQPAGGVGPQAGTDPGLADRRLAPASQRPGIGRKSDRRVATYRK